MIFETLISPEELESRLHDPDWVVFDCRHRLSDADPGRLVATGNQPSNAAGA